MDYIEAFKNLRTNNKYGRKSPHKAILMLTVIELYEQNVLTDNEIFYNEMLKSMFLKVWNRVLPKEPLFHPDAYLPFWYLQSDSFWHIVPKRGKEDILSLMRDTNIKPSETKLNDSVKCAELDEDLYFLMTIASGRSSLKRVLLETYTSLSENQISKLAESRDNTIDYSASALSEYEQILSRDKDEDKKESMEVDDKLVMQFQKLSEEVQLTLYIEYFSYLKKHSSERELFKKICPSVYNLVDKIVNHPIEQGDIIPSVAFVYDNFLSDLKISLMSEGGAMEFIDKIGEAIDILRGEKNRDFVEVFLNEEGKEKEHTLSSEKMEEEDTPFVQHVGTDKDNRDEIENVKTKEATIVLTEDMIEAARTPNGGFTKSQLAAIGIGWPPPLDWIQEKAGTMITPTQLEAFNHIEYVSNPTKTYYFKKGRRTYRDVASNEVELKRMEAVLDAMSHFTLPATPRDIARTVSRSAWGDLVNEESVDSILKRLPEVEYVQWGKYKLKEE